MKKILLSLLGMGTIFSLTAQNWVSTTPENRKVVLEEFTGVRCTFCPDGHKRAQAMKDENEGKVFLINVHAGSFAVPGSGDLDLRTPEGTALDNAAGTMGYPNGSVNRNKSPWNSSRTVWASEGANILSESSPVNVYVKSSVDYQTRELTTTVEVYYTSAGASSNRLSVALLQNEILGRQTGATTFYPENFYKGEYIHNHVFRRFLSSNGVNGETLDSTNSNAFISRTFTTTLPANIGTIPLDINKLEVVAFVTANGRNKIWSGAEAVVETNDPSFADLSYANKTVSSTGNLCAQISPVVSVTNNGNAPISSFDLALKSGNSNLETKNVSTTLAPGESTDVNFTPTYGDGSYNFTVESSNIDGGSKSDVRFSNDKVNISGLAFTPKAFSYLKTNLNGSVDANVGLDLSENSNVVLATNAGQSSSGSLRFAIHTSWGVAGLPGHVILGEADFAGITDPRVSYYYAYSDGSQGGSAPSIKVAVSEDCGTTWKEVNSTNCSETGQPSDPRNFYVPQTGDFKQVIVDLKDYSEKTVLVRVSGVPGSSGNALYIDAIEVGSTAKIVGVEKVSNIGLEVYPNPSSSIINVRAESQNLSINLTDLQGKTLKTFSASNGQSEINVSNLPKGVYMLEVISEGVKEVVKISVI